MDGRFPRMAGTSFGNGGLYAVLVGIMRRVSPQCFYRIAAWCVVPVTMVLSPGARIAFDYYRHRRGQSFWHSVWSVYRNHCLFAKTVIDKFAMYAGRKFPINLHGEDVYSAMSKRPEPFLQLSAHVGCSEILGYSYAVGKPCNVLAYGGERPGLMHYREKQFGHMNINIIPVGTGQSHSSDVLSAIDRGEIISAFADRYADCRKTLVSQIHGQSVLLAKGPFQLAVTQGMDVVMASAMKEADGTYTAYFTPLHYDKSLPKSVQRQQLANAYTREMERLLELHPMQWFNYFNLWEAEKKSNKQQ